MTVMTNDQLSHLADRLRRCYQFERNNFEYKCGRPHDYRVPSCWDAGGPESREASIWHKLARFCQRRKIDPFRYVRWCLDMNQLGLNPPPEPNMLLSAERMDSYLARQAMAKKHVRIRVQVETQAAESQFHFQLFCCKSQRRAWGLTLGSGGLDLSPLTRYLIALKLGGETFLALAAKYEALALYQYYENPAAYDACWRDMIPPGFAERAAAQYQLFLDQQS
jgi:hypothetical protein